MHGMSCRGGVLALAFAFLRQVARARTTRTSTSNPILRSNVRAEGEGQGSRPPDLRRRRSGHQRQEREEDRRPTCFIDDATIRTSPRIQRVPDCKIEFPRDCRPLPLEVRQPSARAQQSEADIGLGQGLDRQLTPNALTRRRADGRTPPPLLCATPGHRAEGPRDCSREQRASPFFPSGVCSVRSLWSSVALWFVCF